jgi:hypothetical protein
VKISQKITKEAGDIENLSKDHEDMAISGPENFDGCEGIICPAAASLLYLSTEEKIRPCVFTDS